MPSSHLILCRHLLLPPIPPSIRVFSNESTLHMRWPKYWSFSFSISPSNEHPGLISFRMDWLDLLAVQRTLESLLQHHSSKASVFRCSAFFTVQLSHPFMTTGKTITLTRRTFVGKVMSLLFNVLSRLVITLLPRSKRLLISWLQSPSTVILEPPKIKSDTASTVSPSISHEVMGLDAMILVFWMLSFKPTFSLSSNYRVEEVKKKKFPLTGHQDGTSSWMSKSPAEKDLHTVRNNRLLPSLFPTEEKISTSSGWLFGFHAVIITWKSFACLHNLGYGPCPMLLVPAHKLSLHASPLPPQGLGICCPEIKNTCLLVLCRWGSWNILIFEVLAKMSLPQSGLF